MIGLDTSIVLRLLVLEPEEQATLAARRLQQAVAEGEQVIVTDLVAAEAYHALRHHYRVPEAEARLLLIRLATSGVVRLEPPEAVAAFDAIPGPGLLDRLIHARHRAVGATTLTFDRQQGRLGGAVVLE